MKNDSTKVLQYLDSNTNKFEYCEGNDGSIKISSYDEKDDTLKIKSMQKKWRDSFTGNSLDLTKWEVFENHPSQTISVANGVLTINSGTTPNATTVLAVKEVFSIPFRAMCGFLLSQRIANQSFYIDMVSCDKNGNVDGKYIASWKLTGTSTTKARYDVMNASSILSSGDVTIATTASSAILELEPFSDEMWFHSRVMDSTNGRSNSYVRHQQIPDPNSFYRVCLRVVNDAIAPASNTSMQIQYMVVNDYAELTAEITAGRGNIVQGQAMAVQMVGGTANVTVAGGVAHDAVISGNPVRVGARAMTANYPSVASGDTSDIITTVVGAQIIKPYSIPELEWSYTGVPIINTTDVTVKTAGGAGIRNYIMSFQYQNTNAVATEIVLKDGSVVIWRGYAPANMSNPSNIIFGNPIKGTANTALNCACITTGANIYLNVQGYQAP